MSLNHKLDTFVSPVPDPLTYAVDAMSISWKGMFAYAFPMRADAGSLDLDALFFLSAETVDSL
jgi:hypothetical protein